MAIAGVKPVKVEYLDDKVGYVTYYPEYGYSIMLSRGSLIRQEYWASGDKRTIEVVGNIHQDEELMR